jgi:hypothetical protein
MYAYVGGNPLAYTDPLGLRQQSCCARPQLPPVAPAHKVPSAPRPVPAAPFRPPNNVIPFPAVPPIGAPALGWTAAISSAILVPAIYYRINNPLPGSLMNPLPPPRMGQPISCVGGPYYSKPFPIPLSSPLAPDIQRREEQCKKRIRQCDDWVDETFKDDPDLQRFGYQECYESYRRCLVYLPQLWPDGKPDLP